jgi:surface protein
MTLCIHTPAMGPSSVRTMLTRGYAAFLSSSAVFTGNLFFVSAAVRQAPSPESYYVAPNGVTVMCPGVAVGDTFDINDLTFTKVDSTTLQSLVSNGGDSWPQLATSCTTGVTDMSNLFNKQGEFNVDISSWDTSSVTDMYQMFYVRAHPACCCCSCIAVSSSSAVPHPLAPRSPLTPHGRPSLVAM